ncbi:ABC transporter permease [Clostridium sp. C2-6-12]|uniref:ABC transporter permease n=1 Tax=Clostridium sp. C2-6-12 TaxID=2698832 RepID=UPI001371187A|nr:ABC transporter permease [Clostridium sp. C2-6-12]
MTLSIRRVRALIKKEMKDFSKNINILFMCIVPIIMSLIFSRIFNGSEQLKEYIMNVSLNSNLMLVSGFTTAALIAEEKEKNTLRTLMLSAVSPIEFLAGKIFVTLVISIGVNVLTYFIMGMKLSYIGQFIIITTLVAICFIEFGAIVGILAESQMSTGTIGMPFFMIMFFVGTLSKMSNIAGFVANFLPNYNMEVLLNRVYANEAISINFAYNISVILIWIMMGAGIFAYAYKKKKLD